MDEGLWKDCGAFHGHTCPGLATGYRMTEIAMDFLGIPLEKAKDEELVCIAENEACGVDAVQVLLSCTPGKGNMIFRKKGKMAFTFFDRRTGKGVRVVAKPIPRDGDRQELMRKLVPTYRDPAEVNAEAEHFTQEDHEPLDYVGTYEESVEERQNSVSEQVFIGV